MADTTTPCRCGTEALVLRHFSPADAPALLALNAEPSTRHWLPSHAYPDLQAAQAALQYLIACCASPGDPRAAPFVLAVASKATAELLGHVGFSPLADEVEVSYALAESVRGQGLGTAALVTACREVAARFGLARLVAITASANHASRRVLEKAGFLHEGDALERFQGSEQSVSHYLWQAAPEGPHA